MTINRVFGTNPDNSRSPVTNRISVLPDAQRNIDSFFTVDIPPNAQWSKFGIYRKETPGEVLLTKIGEIWREGNFVEAGKRFALALPVYAMESAGVFISLVGTLGLALARHPVFACGVSTIAGIKGVEEAGVKGLMLGLSAGPAACLATLSTCVLGSSLMYGANRIFHYMRHMQGDTKLPWAHAFEETPLKHQYNYDPAMQQSASFFKSIYNAARSCRAYLPF